MWETSTPKEHVSSGPLARAGSHADPNPLHDSVFSRFRVGHHTFGPAGRLAMTVLIGLCALLFYSLYPTPITFAWIAPIALGGAALLRFVWRHGRVA